MWDWWFQIRDEVACSEIIDRIISSDHCFLCLANYGSYLRPPRMCDTIQGNSSRVNGMIGTMRN